MPPDGLYRDTGNGSGYSLTTYMKRRICPEEK